MTHWSEDETFWEAMEPALCAPGRLALTDQDVPAILTAVQARPGSRVLDLGCGPGAHAVGLARLGHHVTGVDTSRRLLERGRSAARAEGVEVEWVQADMREFQRPSSFDLICSLYASFGYFDDSVNRRVLENVLTSLVPHGALVLDLIGREAAARNRQDRRSHEVEDVLYLERRSSTDGWVSMTSEWIVVRKGERAEFRVTQRLYSGTELRELLLSLGFTKVQLAGGLDGTTPYDQSAQRLVAIARRPDGR